MFGVFLTLIPIHLHETFGLSPTQRGLVAAVPAVTSTATALVVTWFRVRMSAGVMVAIGLGVFGATFVAMGLGSLWLLVAAAAVYGLAEGITIPTLQDLVAERAPEHLRGTILALWVSSLRLGQTAGPLVVGVAIGFWSTGTVLAGAGVLVMVVGVAVGTSRVLPDGRPSADASL
jgi:sugar phosphate permease